MLLNSAREDSLQYENTAFVQEMGVFPEQTEAFDVEQQVVKFLHEEQKRVLLIQGGGGSGKSLFCHIFSKKLLEEG